MNTITRSFRTTQKLDTQIVRAAARETLSAGKTVTKSEWIRDACEQKLLVQQEAEK